MHHYHHHYQNVLYERECGDDDIPFLDGRRCAQKSFRATQTFYALRGEIRGCVFERLACFFCFARVVRVCVNAFTDDYSIVFSFNISQGTVNQEFRFRRANATSLYSKRAGAQSTSSSPQTLPREELTFPESN